MISTAKAVTLIALTPIALGIGICLIPFAVLIVTPDFIRSMKDAR